MATVPEFLAKQLLKQFGFPWHVAPGEAEAECALLQREGVVDAVLSEDVDTLMFGSGVTLRNWTTEGSTKGKGSPTHVSVYRAEETKERSGLDKEGMILVALMSGGDYLPEGIPKCGPKVACDAARAGFGSDLCKLGRKDGVGLKAWKERLQHEIRTNESKFFSRKSTGFIVPEDFPSMEVLGYYTHPCVSTPEKVARLRQELRWDQPIDYPALQSFVADAFDWRCLGGAMKFIRNLAPAMLVRELRQRGQNDESLSQQSQEECERELIQAIHGKRNHHSTDGELEYRISFTPATLVPIDLGIEDEDDDFIPAGGAADDSDAESEFTTLPSSTADSGDNDKDSEAPASPSKKRNFKPYHPDQPEKLWILQPFLQIGCPLLVEDYEASLKDPKEFLKARRKARAAGAKGAEGNIHARTKKGRGKKAADDMPAKALMAFAKVTKQASAVREAMKELPSVQQSNGGSDQQAAQRNSLHGDDENSAAKSGFKFPSTQIPAELLRDNTIKPTQPAPSSQPAVEASSGPAVMKTRRPFAAFAAPRPSSSQVSAAQDAQKTPSRKKRPSRDVPSPAASQRTITLYYSPSPRKPFKATITETIDLISSSPVRVQQHVERPSTPTPLPDTRFQFIRTSSPNLNPPAQPDFSPGKLPDTVTKRRKKGPLRRWQTAPALGEAEDEDMLALPTPTSRNATPTEVELQNMPGASMVDAMDLISSSPAKSEGSLPSPSFIVGRSRDVSALEDVDATPRAAGRNIVAIMSSPPHSPSSLRMNEDAAKKVDWWFGSDHGTQPQGTVGPAEDDRTFWADREPPPTSSLPTPPAEELELPPVPPLPTKKAAKPPKPLSHAAPSRRSPRIQARATSASQPLRRSPRQQVKKMRIQLRQSLEGAWKEVVDAEAIDMTGDGSGWKASKGRAEIVGSSARGGWRKSGVEVLDLTGA